METDHISERELSEAYQAGWADYPRKLFGDNPFRNAHLILAQAWECGWVHAEEEKEL